MLSDSVAMNGRLVELHPSDVLGRYELLMPIGSGGMGQVWAARLIGSQGIQELVAVKTLLPCDDVTELQDSMLLAEASLASRVRHPNVAETLDFGEQGHILYLVMEWIDGQSLDRVAAVASRAGGIPLELAVQWIAQACKGLEAVHEASDERGEALGLVHRDISPHNLLVTYSGILKVIDFGVAKATFRDMNRTAVGQLKGKFGYMAPEQVQSEPVDGRADLFALGVVLYSLTVGRHPFKGETPAATVWNVLSADPELPTAVVPGYPAELEAVVMRALAKNKEARFSSAREMHAELERACPRATDTGIEQRTQLLLRGLFAEEIAERTQLLSDALDVARRAAASSGPMRPPLGSQANSTMRAVAIDSGNGVPAQVQQPEQPSGDATKRVARRPFSKGKMLVIAAILAPLGCWWLQAALVRGVGFTGAAALAPEMPCVGVAAMSASAPAWRAASPVAGSPARRAVGRTDPDGAPSGVGVAAAISSASHAPSASQPSGATSDVSKRKARPDEDGDHTKAGARHFRVPVP